MNRRMAEESETVESGIENLSEGVDDGGGDVTVRNSTNRGFISTPPLNHRKWDHSGDTSHR